MFSSRKVPAKRYVMPHLIGLNETDAQHRSTSPNCAQSKLRHRPQWPTQP